MVQPESRLRGWVLAGLGATLLLLLAHAAVYAFLTDDAFISFRYARNLAGGYGLVFNPGFERVEGYTNFLWVLALAALQAIGIAPESVANLLSLAATVALWGLVARYALRDSPGKYGGALAILPCFWLAVTRSVAVWSTSGLETRLYEVLVFGGCLRLIDQVEEAQSRSTRGAGRPWTALLFGLATLTRPDGLLVSAMAFGTAGLFLAIKGRLPLARAAFELGTYGLIVGAQFAFRLAYYGEWLPNTYYAKVGGRWWWEMGGNYLALFALEYAAFLWVPLLVAGIGYHRKRKTLFVPILVGAVLVPHALYIASIGGDHFEYRPLDIAFPFIFLLLYQGAKHLAIRRYGALATALLSGLVTLGLVWLPYQSHRQFPRRFVAGFPGGPQARESAEGYLRPEHDPLFHLPGLRWLAATHRRLLCEATDHFVGLRQEEHRLFLESIVPEGRRVRAWIQEGILPADLHVALSAVGAIPYITDLRTLDRLGLTDARVARAAIVVTGKRILAHEKRDAFEYARAAGVEYWPLRAARLFLSQGDPALVPALAEASRQGVPIYVADLGGGDMLVGQLPQGLDRTQGRFPRLTFTPLQDPRSFMGLSRQVANALRAKLQSSPEDVGIRLGLAQAELAAGEPARAEALFEDVTRARPSSIAAWKGLAGSRAGRGNVASAVMALERAIALAREAGSEEDARDLQNAVDRLRAGRSG